MTALKSESGVREAGVRGAVFDAVRAGLLVEAGGQRSLPPWLFYDDEGSRLFEAITELPEYYLTRTERALLEANADDIVARARGDAARLHLVELGAGTASKTQLLLAALVRQQGSALFMPIDVSGGALNVARARLARELPAVEVRAVVGRHDEAVEHVRALGARRLVCFIGSSLGNFSDEENVALLSSVASALAPGGALLLGADRRKAPATLLPAYDDDAGVTARFNKNILLRLNRELGADFDVAAFKHEARFDDERSRIEMHLVATREMTVRVPGLPTPLAFRAGESIHTENSVKYDDTRIDRILTTASFVREHSYVDDEGRFGLHLCRRA
jgi:dimethylhistidine N-methyltransferase